MAAGTAFMPPSCEVTLLVPRRFVGRFGSQVRYLVARNVYRWMPALMPRYDVWHSIHQLSPFRPSSSSTRRVLTIHDVNFMYEKSTAKQRKYLRRLQRECDSAAEVCFISQFAREDTMRYVDLQGKLSMLLDHTPASDTAHHGRGVADPWYTRDFDTAYEDIYIGCQALLDELSVEG